MKTFVVLSCLIAAAIAQCPPSGCPPPVDPPNCGIPDCSIIQNRIHENALWPIANDPSSFWQCAPGPQPGEWSPIRRSCACGTSFNVNEYPRRCTFWFDRSWSVPPGCNWSNPPEVTTCAPWCPDCNGNGPQVPPGPTPPPGQPPVTPAPPQTPPSTPPGCNCPCPPCIWWPCVPCNPCMC